jgi:hypothetical protein
VSRARLERGRLDLAGGGEDVAFGEFVGFVAEAADELEGLAVAADPQGGEVVAQAFEDEGVGELGGPADQGGAAGQAGGVAGGLAEVGGQGLGGALERDRGGVVDGGVDELDEVGEGRVGVGVVAGAGDRQVDRGGRHFARGGDVADRGVVAALEGRVEAEPAADVQEAAVLSVRCAEEGVDPGLGGARVLARVGGVVQALEGAAQAGEVEAVAAGEGSPAGWWGAPATEARPGRPAWARAWAVRVGSSAASTGRSRPAVVREEDDLGGGAAQGRPELAQLGDLVGDLAAGAADRGEAVGGEGEELDGADQAGAVEGVAGAGGEREGLDRGVLGEAGQGVALLVGREGGGVGAGRGARGLGELVPRREHGGGVGEAVGDVDREGALEEVGEAVAGGRRRSARARGPEWRRARAGRRRGATRSGGCR